MAVNTGVFDTHLGLTLAPNRGHTGTTPSTSRGREAGQRQKEECRMQKAERNDCFGSDSTAHGYAVKFGALTEE